MNRTILIVRDEKEDVSLDKAMKAAGVESRVQTADDSREALDYCNGNGRFANRQEFPIPDLILLQWESPNAKALQVLRWLRQQPLFQWTSIIVLASSKHVADVAAAYCLGASAYVQRPTDKKGLESLVRSVSDFWLARNVPPPMH